MQLPVARSIPIFPAIAADHTHSRLLKSPPLSDMVLKQINLFRFVIFASMVILGIEIWTQFPGFIPTNPSLHARR
jgi:hypothetical protein